MRAVNIKWNTDGDEELLAKLPKEKKLPDCIKTKEEASEWITEVTGFSHYGFELRE